EVLPLPFRIAVLFQLGVHLWHAMVWVCYHIYRVNCLALLNLSYSNYNYTLDGHAKGIVSGLMASIAPADPMENVVLIRGIRATAQKLFSALAVCLVGCWVCRWLVDENSMIYPLIINGLSIFVLCYSFYVAFGRGKSMGQQRVHSTVFRVLAGKINSESMRTNDIFFSDGLTSYAKVLNDLACYIWITFVTSNSLYNTRVEALVLSYPQLVRMKQCLYEYKTTQKKQHIFNFLNYTALLGPIIVNMLIKLSILKLGSEKEISTTNLDTLNWWWFVTSFASSFYLFIWDVRMDWGLGLLEPLFKSRSKYEPLRAGRLVYGKPALYYTMILINLVLRVVWVFKIFVIMETEIELGLRHRVGNFLFGYNFLLAGYVILETLELLRRWLWCLLKWENDLAKLHN
ncbi:hypothetical protein METBISCDRAFT_4563, partial [Metschnikowia bicuspidata]